MRGDSVLRKYPSEHEEQSDVIRWARSKGLVLLFSIPNGTYTNISVAKRLKQSGLTPGIPDLFLAIPRPPYHGLFIEMKAIKGKPSSLQKAWLKALNTQGYLAVVCYGFEEAKKIIEDYLK